MSSDSDSVVYVLAYEHSHGTDVTVYRTREGALQAGFEIIESYLADDDDVKFAKRDLTSHGGTPVEEGEWLAIVPAQIEE